MNERCMCFDTIHYTWWRRRWCLLPLSPVWLPSLLSCLSSTSSYLSSRPFWLSTVLNFSVNVSKLRSKILEHHDQILFTEQDGNIAQLVLSLSLPVIYKCINYHKLSHDYARWRSLGKYSLLLQRSYTRQGMRWTLMARYQRKNHPLIQR